MYARKRTGLFIYQSTRLCIIAVAVTLGTEIKGVKVRLWSTSSVKTFHLIHVII